MQVEKQSLIIKRDVDGKAEVFPSTGRPAILDAFTYTAQRMAGAPTITATLMYERPLDDDWSRAEYVEFQGEKYYLDQVPTSSKANTDLLYKHELTLYSERIALEGVKFLDVVAQNEEDRYKDRVRSNYTSLKFYGDIEELAYRINSSLAYSKLYDPATGEGYHVVIDQAAIDAQNAKKEEKRTKSITFDVKSVNEVLQEFHNTFELAYYFVGKTIHVGYEENALQEVIEYGSGNALLSITKTNSNYEIVNRITGVGSSDNLPYYYPNDSPIGTAQYEVTGTGADNSVIEKIELDTLNRQVTDPMRYTYGIKTHGIWTEWDKSEDSKYKDKLLQYLKIYHNIVYAYNKADDYYNASRTTKIKYDTFGEADGYESVAITKADGGNANETPDNSVVCAFGKSIPKYIKYGLATTLNGIYRDINTQSCTKVVSKSLFLGGIEGSYVDVSGRTLVSIVQSIFKFNVFNSDNRSEPMKRVDYAFTNDISKCEIAVWCSVKTKEGGKEVERYYALNDAAKNLYQPTEDFRQKLLDGTATERNTHTAKSIDANSLDYYKKQGWYVADAVELAPLKSLYIGEKLGEFTSAEGGKKDYSAKITIYAQASYYPGSTTSALRGMDGWSKYPMISPSDFEQEYSIPGYDGKHVGISIIDSTYQDYEMSLIKRQGDNSSNRFVFYPVISMRFDSVLSFSTKNTGNNIIYNPDDPLNPYAYDNDYEAYHDNIKEIPLAQSGFTFAIPFSNLPADLTILLAGKNKMDYSKNLMPSIYRTSHGTERFYNAINAKYKVPAESDVDKAYTDDKGYYKFHNTYLPQHPHEAKQDFSDIKPSIVGVRNSQDKLYGEIAGIAFDKDDNDLKRTDSIKNATFDGTDEYEHSWFYVNLNVFDGKEGDIDYTFNLFQYAIASESAHIEMTSGVAAGCKFEIGVEKVLNTANAEYTFHNPVQADSKGNIASGNFSTTDDTKNDKVRKGVWQAHQQDTSKNSVWIAVKKDTETYGMLIPNRTYGYLPKVGDKFVITGIRMPKALILAAEKHLEEALIRYMAENNNEKFQFSITFSRIWLARHPDFSSKLNENARLEVKYNGVIHTLYVSSISCKHENDILAEVSIELSDELVISQNGIQRQIAEAKSDIISSLSGGSTKAGDDIAKLSKYFLRKDIADTSQGNINFVSGLNAENSSTFEKEIGSRQYAEGITGYGWKIDENGNAQADSLTLRSFLEVPELRFNRTQVILGDEWQAPGGGIIESCTPSAKLGSDGKPEGRGTAKLHLETGEIGAIAEGDFCMGYFHFENGSGHEDANADADQDDRRGNMTHAGFATVYFQITKVSSVNGTNDTFDYLLRGNEDGWTANGIHPQAQMHFVSYGHVMYGDEAKDKAMAIRRASVLRTKTYTRYLTDVNSYTFNNTNIRQQEGDLSGLEIDGTDVRGEHTTIKMDGYGAYLSNVYIDGTLRQFTTIRPSLTFYETTGHTDIAYGETLRFRCIVKDSYGADITKQYDSWTIMRNSGDQAADDLWNAQNQTSRITWGETGEYEVGDDGTPKPVEGRYFTLRWGDDGTTITDDLGSEGASFTITASPKAEAAAKGMKAVTAILNT